MSSEQRTGIDFDFRRLERTDSLVKCFLPVILSSTSGGIAQLVERLVRNEKARGSNPLTSKGFAEQNSTPGEG